MSHWEPVRIGTLVFFFVLWLPAAAVLGQPNQPLLDVKIQSFPGVQRVEVTTGDKKPVATDLELQIVGNLRDFGNVQQSVSVDLTIPAGSSTGSAELPFLVPSGAWYWMSLHLEQDRNGAYGRRDFMTTSIQASGFGTQAANVHLFVSSNLTGIPEETIRCSPKSQTSYGTSGLSVANPAALPSLRHLAPLIENQVGLGTVTTDISLLQNAAEIFKSVHPSDFFEKWTSLAMFQTILVSYGDLAQLARSPAKIEALRKWLVAGGQAIVFDCGAGFEQRDEILDLLRGKPGHTDHQWQQARGTLNASHSRLAVDTNSQPDSGISVAVADVGPESTKFAEATGIADQPWLKTDVMRGRLFVIGSEMTDWPEENWRSLYNAVDLSAFSVVKSLGQNPLNRAYDQTFLIPGIGKPPVLVFQVLIAMFVLLIGPGFYFFFNATGRLHLLLISTPLFALAAVVSLFGYGIISDGFAVRGRVASVTEIDHSTSNALVHARHAFYAGVAPRECVFDSESLVVDSRADFSPMTRYRFGNDRLTISGGQIKSRSPFQLTSLASFQTDLKLTFSPLSSDPMTGSITNGFDDRIELAVVRTDSGWFMAEGIPPQSAGTALAVKLPEINPKLRRFMLLPLPVEPSRRRNQTFSNRRIGFYRYDDDVYGLGSWGLSDRSIASLSRGPDDDNLPVGSYIAIMRTNSLVADPLPAAVFGEQGENQLHVIVGKW